MSLGHVFDNDGKGQLGPLHVVAFAEENVKHEVNVQLEALVRQKFCLEHLENRESRRQGQL
jgi:hypothetical protein